MGRVSNPYDPVTVEYPPDFPEDLAGSISTYLQRLATEAKDLALGMDIPLGFGDLPEQTQPPVWPDILNPDNFIDVFGIIEKLFERFPSDVPDFTLQYSEERFDISELEALYTRIRDDVNAGYYGLDPASEEALYQRFRDREQMLAQEGLDKAVRLHATGGFSLPTGAAVAATRSREREVLEKISEASREVMIKRADMLFEGRKTSYALMESIQKTMGELHNATMARVLEGAKAQLQAAIQAFMAQIDSYKALVEAYKSGFDAHAGGLASYAKAYEAMVSAWAAEVKASLERITQTASLRLERKKTLGQMYTSIAASALSAMNVNASMSQSNSFSQGISKSSSSSESYNAQNSDSTSDTESTNVNTSYEPDAGVVRTTHWLTGELD